MSHSRDVHTLGFTYFLLPYLHDWAYFFIVLYFKRFVNVLLTYMYVLVILLNDTLYSRRQRTLASWLNIYIVEFVEIDDLIEMLTSCNIRNKP